MLRSDRLRRALTRAPRLAITRLTFCRQVNAVVFRAFVAPGKRRTSPLYALGAPAHGGRFTPRGGPSALYLAGDALTAAREALQVTAPAPVRPGLGASWGVFTVEVCLAAVLDLTAAHVRRALGTSVAELSAPWRLRRSPPTQRLGRLAVDVGLEGLLYPSARAGRQCLVVFTGNLRRGSWVRMVEDGLERERLDGTL